MDEFKVGGIALVSAVAYAVIWALTTVMSLTAAVLSVISTMLLAVLGHKVKRKRKARGRTRHQQAPAKKKVKPVSVWRQRSRKLTHPVRTAKPLVRRVRRQARRRFLGWLRRPGTAAANRARQVRHSAYGKLEQRWTARKAGS